MSFLQVLNVPNPPAGLAWASGRFEARPADQAANEWTDGSGAPAWPIVGRLAASGLAFESEGGGGVFTPGTDVGAGTLAGPAMNVTMVLNDTAGTQHRVELRNFVAVASSAGVWDVRSRRATTYANNAGTPAAGLDTTAGDARYRQLADYNVPTQAAGTNSTLAASTAFVQTALAPATAPAAPTLTYNAGATGTLTLAGVAVVGTSRNDAVYHVVYTWQPSVAGGFSSFTIGTVAAGWALAGIAPTLLDVNSGLSTAATFDSATNAVYLNNPTVSTWRVTLVVRLIK